MLACIWSVRDRKSEAAEINHQSRNVFPHTSDIRIWSVLRHHEDRRVEGRRNRGLLGLPVTGFSSRTFRASSRDELTKWNFGPAFIHIPKTRSEIAPGFPLSGTWRDLPAPVPIVPRLRRDGEAGWRLQQSLQMAIRTESSTGDREQVGGAYPFLREAPQIYSAHPTFRTKPECPLV